MALHAADGEFAAHAATAAVFDHVASTFYRRGFANDAVIHLYTALFEQLANHYRAVDRRAFFVAGEQQGDGQRGVGLASHEFFHCHHKGGNGGFHIARAPAKQTAIAVRRGERVTAPLRQGAGGHHIGVACKCY